MHLGISYVYQQVLHQSFEMLTYICKLISRYMYTKSTLPYVIARQEPKKNMVLHVSALFLVANISAECLPLLPNHLFCAIKSCLSTTKMIDICCIASNKRVEIYEAVDHKKGREISTLEFSTLFQSIDRIFHDPYKCLYN